MMKHFFTTLIIFSCCSGAFSQFSWKNIEGEGGFSGIFLYPQKGAALQPGMFLYGELRYRLDDIPIDIGLHVDRGNFKREWKQISYSERYYSTKILMVGHYNFRQYDKISPFVGLELGYSYQDTWCSDYSFPEFGTTERRVKEGVMCFAPRIGVKLFRFLRFSTSYRITKSDYQHWECSVGVVFGGWKDRRVNLGQ